MMARTGPARESQKPGSDHGATKELLFRLVPQARILEAKIDGKAHSGPKSGLLLSKL